MVVNGSERRSLRNLLTPGRRRRILADVKPLNEELFDWRTALKLSRADAARRCEMSQVQWTELETGATCDPRTSTLLKLANGTGLALERLATAAELLLQQRNLMPAL